MLQNWINTVVTHWRDQKKEKVRSLQTFIKTLENLEDKHKRTAIEQEIYYSKIIHALQTVRYLKYKTGRFDQKYWKQTIKFMAEAMITESNMLQNMSENNRAINEAIEKAMKAKSSQ